jgi:hypothetical protein
MKDGQSQKRRLRRGGGGRSSSSGSKSYSGYSGSGSYSGRYSPKASTTYSPTSTTYYKKYGTVKHSTSYSNSYWNSGLGRTYQPLFVYYLPVGFVSTTGFYSPRYGITYYNGYGYNFYYGAYGYYEFSVNPA